MARWTVVDGDQELVIESAGPGLMAISANSGPAFYADADRLKELRAKLGLAIGAVQAGQPERVQDGPQDGGLTTSRGGE